MAELIMPKVGDAMTEGKVIRWYKKAGDAVSKGEPVLEIETDKVNLDLEAASDGTLAEVRAKEGDMIPVGETLAQILAPGEKASVAAPKAPEAAGKDAGAARSKETGDAGRIAGATQSDDEPQRRATDKKDSVK